MTKTLEEIDAEIQEWQQECAAEEDDGITLIYLSGPMTGQPQMGFPAFFEAEQVLRSKGYDVINPARMDSESGFDGNGTPSAEWVAEARRRDVEALQERADALCALPGWEESVGARAEMYVAFWEGMPVYEYPSMRELTWRDTVKTQPVVKKVYETSDATGITPTVKRSVLPESDAERKELKPWKFFFRYFPRAIVEVTKISQGGCSQHSTDGWDRSKSPEEMESLVRHMLDYTQDEDDIKTAAQFAWRAMAQLQKLCEKRLDS